MFGSGWEEKHVIVKYSKVSIGDQVNQSSVYVMSLDSWSGFLSTYMHICEEVSTFAIGRPSRSTYRVENICILCPCNMGCFSLFPCTVCNSPAAELGMRVDVISRWVSLVCYSYCTLSAILQKVLGYYFSWVAAC